MATDGNDDPPVPDIRTMKELCQETLNDRGGPIASIAIQATNFGPKNDMIQQVQNSFQFYGLLGDDANKHLDKFLHITQSIKVNGVTDDALCLYLFPHSLTHHATAWFDHLPRNSITTFEKMAKMFLEKYFLPSMVTKLRNEITNFLQRPDESLFEAWERYKLSIDHCSNHNMLPVTQIDSFYNGLTLRHRDTINAAAALKAEMAEINKNLMKVLQINRQVKAVTHNCETCGGPHSYNDWPATVGQNQNGDKGYGASYYNGSTKDVQPPVVQIETQIPNSEPVEAPPPLAKLRTYMLQEPIIKVVISTNLKDPIICLAIVPKIISHHQGLIRIKTEVNKIKTTKNRIGNNHGIPQGNNQGRNQFFQGASYGQNPPPAYQALAYQALGYQAPVHHAPIPQPEVVTTTEFTNYMMANDAILKNMQTNMTSLTNSNLELKNMFCQFMKMKSLHPRGPTISTTSSLPKVVERETEVTKDTVPPTNNGSTKDIQPLVVQVDTQIPNSEPVVAPVVEPVEAPFRTFHFSADFIVVDFDAYPRVPLILEISFLMTGRALIDVYEGELTLRVGKEAVTFNLDQTSRYLTNYNAMIVNRIDLIDVACEEYSQEVFGFSMSGHPTPSTEPIVSNSSSTLTPFGDSDFLLKETNVFLAIDDVLISPEIDESYYDSEGDIILLEEFYNDDPSSPPLPPQDLKVVEPTIEKSSIDEPLVVELKDLPPHLKYAFLEGDDKLHVIIAKDLKNEEKTALIKEKSHFMVKEGIVLSHKISKNGIEVDKAKVDVISKLPHPTTVKVSMGCQKPGHLAARLECAETKVTTWDDLAFKLIILVWNMKHRNLQIIDP
nr:reverse transcriptase domain-containing protein [Tanacetum cinerariifolium]